MKTVTRIVSDIGDLRRMLLPFTDDMPLVDQFGNREVEVEIVIDLDEGSYLVIRPAKKG